MKNVPVVWDGGVEHHLKSTLFPFRQEDQAFGEQLCQEKGDLLIATEESRSRIKALEEDIETLNHMSVKQEAELERLDAFFKLSPV